MVDDAFADMFKNIFGEKTANRASNITNKEVKLNESKEPIKVPSFVMNNRKNKRENNLYSDDIK